MTKEYQTAAYSFPNIIFIMADQLAASFTGCYGSGVNSTPHLDALAAEGMRFDRCYATCPLCAPNRAAILTGRSPVVHGVTMNNYALQTDCPTYAHVLKSIGYKTGGFGKFHQTPMLWPVPAKLDFLGFEESVITEDPKWGPWIDWVEKNHPGHLETAIAMTNGHGGTVGCIAGRELMQGAREEEVTIKNGAFTKYMEPLTGTSPWSRMYPSPLPAEVHDTKFITDLSLAFIEKCADNKAVPFLCHVSYVDPHDPYDPPVPYDTMFRPEDMRDPEPAEWMEQGPLILDRYRDDYLNFRTICDNKDAVKKLRALYHGSLKFLDDQMGRIIRQIKEAGLWSNTIIIFTTDHGDLMGDHGLITKGEKHYDSSVRCPLIVAGGPVKSGISARLTCSLDFYPAFCDWAGIEAAALPPLEGKSFADVCKGGNEKEPWEEIAVSLDECSSVITDDGYRLTRYSGDGDGQMFDLFNDPHEQNNLYHNPDYKDKKIQLLERLVKVLNRPGTISQYRNLPVRDGRKYIKTNCSESIPFYKLQSSPWLSDGPKPQWR